MGAGDKDIFCQFWRPWPAGRGDGHLQLRGQQEVEGRGPLLSLPVQPRDHTALGKAARGGLWAVGVGGVTDLVCASDIAQPGE